MNLCQLCKKKFDGYSELQKYCFDCYKKYKGGQINMTEQTTQTPTILVAEHQVAVESKKKKYGPETTAAILQMLKEGKTPRQISRLPEMPALPKIKRIIKENS